MVKEINKKHRGFFTMEEDDIRIRNSLLKESVQERNKEIVLNMLKKDMNLELISKLTNLSIEEIEEIKNLG